jgi:voltage-gated potassium channel
VLLRQLEKALEGPMILLGFVWLALLVVELVHGTGRSAQTAATVIWVVFVLDFLLKLWVAPRKLLFLRQQWLTILSLMVPALRVFRVVRLVRVLRAAKAVRGLRLFRLVTSLNRGLRALRASLGRRGAGYVFGLALLLTLAGAAGIYAFEREHEPRLASIGAALWWAAMMMTTVGSDIFPQTAEGRFLCLLMAGVAFAIWGYVTATLATFFVGRDAENEKGELASAKAVEQLREEVRALRMTLEKGLENRDRPAP